ncbi:MULTISPECIES: hypothetical protein [unclassified Streptomyces]|uniref:hypothetical protein n=1 Tax=unclassified Streptomyces TaxID=2593676 RepID=UPI002E30028D|nr:hypothetical protein [Streptomyces sp. NBC_01716]
MSGSDARRFLSRLMSTFGTDGVLVVRKIDGNGDGGGNADAEQVLGPGAVLAWPKCQCGSAKCPDFVPPASNLSARLAERNRHSRRGRHG